MSATTAGVDRITMENFAFTPEDPQVRPGEKITVVNKDSAAHTVTATEGDAFDTGSIADGKSGTFTAPSKAGEYAFVCTFHPNMTGTLIVR
ncbi:cupredoxin domain-containing protein [Streptomyces sp. DT190]